MTHNFAAYDLFLKARAENKKFHMDPSYLRRSVELLEEALRIDPEFPEALTLLAFNRVDLTWIEGRDPQAEGEQARQEVEKAIALNPYSSDAYIVLGAINFYLNWDLAEAQRNFEKGWELSNYGEAPISQCFCGFIGYVLAKGEFHEALSILQTVEKIDPSYPFGVIERMIIFRALKDTAALVQLSSDTSRFQYYEPVYHYELGNYHKAIEGFLDANSDYIWPSTYLAAAYFKAGLIAESDSLVQQMIRRAQHERNIDFGLAVVYAARRDKKEAIKWIQSAYVKHDFWLVYARADRDLQFIIDAPEVVDILNSIGL